MDQTIKKNIINNFIDIHTHILPGIDDGSKNSKMSVEMLKTEKKQGIKTVVFTPHFYSDMDSPESFLLKRENAFERLKEELKNQQISSHEIPDVILGAEVLFFNGMSVAEELKALCIGGTNLLLLEMPFIPWTEQVLQEVDNMSRRLSIIPVVAHLDRYFKIQSKKVLEDLFNKDMIISLNSESIVQRKNRKLSMSLIEKGIVYFMGSDCHNLDSRPPDMDKTIKIFTEEFGEEFFTFFCERAEDILLNVKKEII